MDIVVVINYKGGVGKTTVTSNLAAELAFRGKKILLIDTDGQASPLTETYMRELTTKNWRVTRLAVICPGIIALLALVSLGVPGCTPAEPLRIGFLGGLSGRVADLGIGGRNGAILAVEMRNQRGGINGRQVELIVDDDQQDAELARQAVARLLARKVELIIGPMTSAMALAVLPQVNGAGVPLISPTVTTNALTGLDDQFFRVVSPTAAHVPKSAEYHFRQHGLRRVGLVYDLRNRAYGESWAGDFRSAFEARGGLIVAAIGFDSSTTFSTPGERRTHSPTRRRRAHRQLDGYGSADPATAHA